MPKRVAAILTDWFEDVEFWEPAKALKEAGHEVVTIGLVKGEKVKGKKKKTKVKIDQSFSDEMPENFDALLIPGGYSPDKLRAHEKPVEFVKDFMEKDKPVFSICHAPQILVTADVLQGRTLTCYKSVIKDIENAGAHFIDKEVVVDGNLVSSRNPDDLPAFNKAIVEKLGE